MDFLRRCIHDRISLLGTTSASIYSLEFKDILLIFVLSHSRLSERSSHTTTLITLSTVRRPQRLPQLELPVSLSNTVPALYSWPSFATILNT